MTSTVRSMNTPTNSPTSVRVIAPTIFGLARSRSFIRSHVAATGLWRHGVVMMGDVGVGRGR